ncbi:MAG: DUF87 domain-containing protein [Candidatus Marsarchaeota archaeon]|nr:DUF87 domain-containing protein [Candidatus Marsarchaeota archaeon]MCL5102244.1 DUF87 domain-containing protein [Candidatus Marsarchaeota archaeon]
MQINISEGFDIDAQKVMTGRCCVIGQSGSGKSFLIGVLAEELARAHLPFLIIDTEGEYTNLGKAFNLIVVGNGPEANLGIDTDYKLLFRQSIQAKKPVVMDVSEAIDQQQAVYSAIKALYTVEEDLRSPYLIIIEEADKFVPQIVKNKINVIEEVSVRGRKRGIGLLVATQRPANISKNVLAQCSYGFIGRLTIENDFDSISILLENRKRMEEVAKLSTGEFLPFGLGRDEVFKVKPRSVAHSGSTPVLNYDDTNDVSLDSIIASIKGQGAGSMKPAAVQNTHRKPAVSGPTEKLSVISGAYAPEELEQRLQGTKGPLRLVSFGRYSIEDILPVYVPFIAARIMVPRGRGTEYYEIDRVYDNSMREVAINKSIKVLAHAPKEVRPPDAREVALLERLRRLKHADATKISKELGLSLEQAEKILMGLERKGMVGFDGKNYAVHPIRKSREKLPQTLDAPAYEKAVVLDPNEKLLATAVELNYPGCRLESYDVFYIPFYKVKLRKGNRVKVSVFNPMTLREEKAALFAEVAEA